MARPLREGRWRRRWPLGPVLVGLILLLGALSLASPSAQAADVVYLYDRLGRLMAVVDPASDTAVYRYDAVGNLLSIARQSSATVAVIGFDPPSGPVGATVTIQGTGFSATPAQNAVTFNGVAAAVASASATQLVVAVPTGATTGTIGVTAPGGAATSGAAFTVTSSGGSPTITTFTPTIGTPGTSVAISGTNFDTTPANDRLTVNVSAALVSAATATSLTAAVPSGATSGRLSLVTPGGATQSGDDFFVPPGGAPATDVGFTGRAAIGGSGLPVSMTSPGKMALVVFDGTAGQAFSAGFTGVSIGTAFGTLFRPDGVQLATGNATTTSGAVNSIHATLPVTGTYTLRFVPFYYFGWMTGSFTLTLSEDPPAVPITVDGAALAVTITRPGQHQAVTFTGTAGQRLSLAFTAVTADAHVAIRKPDGTTFTTAYASNGAVLDLPDLPVTGTYTIMVDPAHAGTGSLTLTLSEEMTGSITIDGASVPLSLPRPGQRARLTFTGAAGQRLGLGLTGHTIFTSTTSILKPDGSGLASVGLGPFDGALIPPPLPVTGTYSILVDPYSTYTGNITLTLSEELTGSVTVGGAGVPVSITRPGQRARLTFNGTANQRISMALTPGFPSCGWVAVLKPDATGLGGTGPCQGNFMNPVTLPTTSSSYAVYVDPGGVNTGGVTVTLYATPADFTGSVTINGSALTVNITGPGQNASVTFSATAGQGLTIRGTGSTLGCLYNLAVYKPSTSMTSWAPICGSSWNVGTSAETGIHTIIIDPNGTSTGSVDISVTSP